jgi:cytochrome c-type biogenesis protein CcmE
LKLSKQHQKRLLWVLAGLTVAGIAAALIFKTFSSNMVFFYSPSQLKAGETPTHKSIRIGGMVKSGSLVRHPGSLAIDFIVTDFAQEVPVSYNGILPDLFRESKGVVATGRYNNGRFEASEILAKHDENYMPPEAQHAIDQAKNKAKPAANTGGPASANPSPTLSPDSQRPTPP